MNIPVIVGYGGINPAGRASGDIAYLRTVYDALDASQAENTLLALASLMRRCTVSPSGEITGPDGQKLSRAEARALLEDEVLSGTLIRRIKNFDFDPASVPQGMKLSFTEGGEPSVFTLRKTAKEIAEKLPEGWRQVGQDAAGNLLYTHPPGLDLVVNASRHLGISAAGMLPDGFDPKALYRCKQHPKGLQTTIYAASDAVYSLGIPLEDMMNLVSPDQIGVYASSSLGQHDEFGIGGYQQAALQGLNPSSRHMPFGMPQMPADFVNSYILGSLGHTCGIIGACASYLYNLQKAVADIKSGACRIAFVGNAETPIVPSVIRAFQAMGAMVEDKNMMELDGLTDPAQIDFRRACRPFSDNRGFVMGESAQFCILFDDELAIETGATIHGAVPDVYIHADGFKGSISKPGAGNYLTCARAAAMAEAVIGKDAIKDGVIVYAHGTGTPQNRVSESDIMSRTAQAFNAGKWQVAAIKCFLGHPLGPASGDQLSHLLGFWRHGILPGIKTISGIAPDVHTDRLQFNLEHQKTSPEKFPAALINSKGFGGNNATATIISPQKTMELLTANHGAGKMSGYRKKNEGVAAQSQKNSEEITQGKLMPIYNQTGRIIEGSEIKIESGSIKFPGVEKDITLKPVNPFTD